MEYVYGCVTLNNGTRFRARRDEQGKITYMTHHGAKNASVKIGRSFEEGGEFRVISTNRYLFPDEYLNPHMSQANSDAAKWRLH